MPVARRGEIWLIDLGYAAKTRPSVVLSVSFGDDERAIIAAWIAGGAKTK